MNKKGASEEGNWIFYVIVAIAILVILLIAAQILFKKDISMIDLIKSWFRFR